MPSWSIHLKIAREINKNNKFEKDKFIFGNLIPDADKNWNKKRKEVHYYNDLRFPKCPSKHMIDIGLFIKDYKGRLDDSMIVGYYCHLLTDYYYNKYTYYNKLIQDANNKIISIKLKNNINIPFDKKILSKYKHYDFELYGRYLFNIDHLNINLDKNKIVSSLFLLKDNFIKEEDVIRRINYLNSDFVNFNKINDDEEFNYFMFTKQELDDLLIDCVNYIKKELKKLDINC